LISEHGVLLQRFDLWLVTNAVFGYRLYATIHPCRVELALPAELTEMEFDWLYFLRRSRPLLTLTCSVRVTSITNSALTHYTIVTVEVPSTLLFSNVFLQ
jgi:hypothetical protein